jgi:hypothetical protein
MNLTLVTVSKDSCSMFKKGYKEVKVLYKKNLYEQKDPRLLEEVGDLSLSVERILMLNLSFNYLWAKSH